LMEKNKFEKRKRFDDANKERKSNERSAPGAKG
jgi:hypothetical protein